MKKLLLLIFLVWYIIFMGNKVFAQGSLVGTWKFGLIEKLDATKLVAKANEMGGNIKEEDSIFIFSITAVYVVSRCEHSEMVISDFENTVLIIIQNAYDSMSIHELWGTWTYIGNKLFHIVMESGDEEVYEYNELNNTFILADSKYQSKIITKLLANNLMLIKKGD